LLHIKLKCEFLWNLYFFQKCILLKLDIIYFVFSEVWFSKMQLISTDSFCLHHSIHCASKVHYVIFQDKVADKFKIMCIESFPSLVSLFFSLVATQP
jgi:hypothetical protein